MRRGATPTLVAAVLAAVLLAGCGGGDGDGDAKGKVCASEGGTTACLVDKSGGKVVELEAEGFQPGSELGVAGLDPGAADQIGRVGKVGDNGKLSDKLGYLGGGGQIPEMVVTVQGTGRDGSPVLLTLRRPAS